LVDPNIIKTAQGIQNPQANEVFNRVGDVIHCKGVGSAFSSISSLILTSLNVSSNLCCQVGKRRYTFRRNSHRRRYSGY
jgi:hypothetical protein